MGNRRLHRWLAWSLGTVSLLLVGAVTGWAGAAVFAPPRNLPEASDFTFVELVDGEVGSAIALNTVAAWQQLPAGANRASGVVTAVGVRQGQMVSPGSVLYEVDLRPVVIAEGAVPAFRALAQGTEGADVLQLQHLLAQLGFYQGVEDGGFGPGTQRAVRSWQESLGINDDGVVQPGDIVFAPSLPGRVTLDPEQVFRGATLSGGEAVVSMLSSEPSFHVPATTQQAAMMPIGTRVEIELEGHTWLASVAGQTPAADGSDQVDVLLQGAADHPICHDLCELVPVEGESRLASRVITQQTVSGLVVPSSALLTGADGSVSVTDDAGESHAVEVLASSQGMSVIDGAAAGMRVRIPASVQGAG